MKKAYVFLALAGLIVCHARAESNISEKQVEIMNKLLATYTQQAKVEFKEEKGRGAVSDKPFTAAEGRRFYLVRRTWQSGDFTCSGCHTDDPKKVGQHIETKEPIKPLAPSVNPERFINAQKVEANFTAHCMDLHDRDCRAHEKGNLITYLMSVK
jgi:mono/diheme cytochrome c family protein